MHYLSTISLTMVGYLVRAHIHLQQRLQLLLRRGSASEAPLQDGRSQPPALLAVMVCPVITILNRMFFSAYAINILQHH